MTPKTPEQYAAEGGTKCPCCGSTDVKGGSIEVDAGCAWQEIECSECDAAWRDQYKLVGYSGLESAEEA